MLVFVCWNFLQAPTFSKHAGLSNEDMGCIILWQGVKAEYWEYVHVYILNHEADVRETTDSLYIFRLNLSPKNKIDKNFGNFFERFQVYIFCS